MAYMMSSALDTAAPPTLSATSRLFQLFAEPVRLRILELLLEGERNVGELVAALGMQQGRVSSHLACLRWCGFVGTRREGKFVYYRILDPRVGDLVHLAHRLLADHGTALISCACCLPRHEGDDDDDGPNACR